MRSMKVMVLALVFGFFGGLVAVKWDGPGSSEESLDQSLMRDFYQTEVAVHVSPHHLRKAIAKGDDSFVLVDLRSPEEYEREHVVGAINIPAYKDSETSAYGEVDRIVGSFEELIASNPDKEVIAYCYSIPCMTGRKIGNLLAEHGVYVKQLGVGWNEWRYFWSLWNHEHEWDQTDVMDYVVSGSEPGSYVGDGSLPEGCSLESDLGC